ncbi:MAG: TlpA family protein disulfide reductase [Candidatus Azobacteroides sp.]|nr:TlpA family protein disulfide reductase [Candidatus Azobacteroides sp.]
MNTISKTLLLFIGIYWLGSTQLYASNDGRAIVTGKFTDSLLDEHSNIYDIIKLSVPNVVLGSIISYQKNVESDGTFIIEIPIVSSAYATVSIGSEEYKGQVLLSPGDTTLFDLFLDKTGKLNLKMIDGIELTPEDIANFGIGTRIIREVAVDGRNVPNYQLPLTPKAYADSSLMRMKKDLAVIDGDSMLTENSKKLLYNFFYPFYLYGFFDYEDKQRMLFAIEKREQKNDKKEAFIPQKPDKAYYDFLQYFDLNHPSQLNEMYYAINLRTILLRSELNIPRIGDTAIANWIKDVKVILSGLTKINSGLFYDILAAEAYIIQLNRLNPLSERQKENIRTYFSNPSFSDILFLKNKDTIIRLKQIEKNKQLNLVINEMPSVAKEKLMDTILSKYKGKTIVVDFWATWCSPCMEAINEIHPLKQEFENKNIVFVYITDSSSSKELWDKIIQEIGGEQYYLTKDELEYVANKFDFNGFPTYLLFNSNGILKNKISNYPGNEKMREMIEKLLP